MIGGWANPHREQHTIPQGQTSSPPKSFFTPTAKARPTRRRARRSQENGAPHTEHGLGVLLASWSGTDPKGKPIRVNPIPEEVNGLRINPKANPILEDVNGLGLRVNPRG